MSYEIFEKIIIALQNISERYSSLYDLGIDLLEYDEPYQKIISIFLNEFFGEQGADWINWYLYERITGSGEILKAWDEDNNEICHNIKSLWETVKND